VREGQLLGENYLELARESSKALESAWKRGGVTGGGAAPS
jgi:hypothetical protein